MTRLEFIGEKMADGFWHDRPDCRHMDIVDAFSMAIDESDLPDSNISAGCYDGFSRRWVTLIATEVHDE